MVRGRGARTEPVLVWAETGRTDGLKGTLGGLSGAPALDAQGRVMGVTIAEAPRRGPHLHHRAGDHRTRPWSPSGRHAARGRAGDGDHRRQLRRVADDLRRDLRVAQVVCLTT